jgi:hypothetical protein
MNGAGQLNRGLDGTSTCGRMFVRTWDGPRASAARFGQAPKQHREAKLEGGVEMRRLEYRRRRGQARALAHDEFVRCRLRRRGSRCVARRFVERRADDVVAEHAEGLCGKAVVGNRRMEVPQDPLDEGYACGRVEPMQRDVVEQPRVTVRHRAVFAAEERHPRDRIGGGVRLPDARNGVLDDRVQKVLLAGVVVVDAHRLAPQRRGQPTRGEPGKAFALGQLERGSQNSRLR